MSLTDFNGNKYCVSKENKTRPEYIAEKLRNSKVGDYIVFGSYEQDKDKLNGKVDIEWLVLDKKENKILVISRYGIDAQAYEVSKTHKTWENCSLRKWLNLTFIRNAFSSDEQKLIHYTTVIADKNPTSSVMPGNSTNDKVFLLSITEALEYFDSEEAGKCVPTDYTKKRVNDTCDKYKTKDGQYTCWWWLRSPGCEERTAAYVAAYGRVIFGGGASTRTLCAIRPAMWINLGS